MTKAKRLREIKAGGKLQTKKITAPRVSGSTRKKLHGDENQGWILDRANKSAKDESPQQEV